MRFFGCDTAQKNLGLAVLSDSPGPDPFLVHYERFTPKTNYPDSDFIVNGLCMQRVRALLDTHKPDYACLESPAYAAKHGAFSIGSIHGALLQEFVDRRIAFVYCTPGKHKFVLTGNGKATKTMIKNVIKEMFSITGRFNSDQADAIGFALVAFMFAAIRQAEKINTEPHFPKGLDAKRIKQIFFQRSPPNKRTGRLPGIMHRVNEFYWTPHEREEL